MGTACEGCTSGWVKSGGACIPYTPLLYKAALWAAYEASIAPAPAPAIGAVPPPAPALLSEAVSGSGSATNLSAALADAPEAPGSAGVESYSPEPENASATAPAPDLLPAGLGADPSPVSALGLNNGSLADADSAARPDPQGPHIMLLSGTSAGGLCILVLLIAAVISCVQRRKQSKQLQQQKLYLASKDSQSGMEQGGGDGDEGGDGYGGSGAKASPHDTTPKGLRQAYAKAAALHQGSWRSCSMNAAVVQ